jgi:hypothetical protein
MNQRRLASILAFPKGPVTHLSWHGSKQPHIPEHCPRCGASLDFESETLEPHTNLIFIGLLSFALIILVVTVLIYHSQANALAERRASQSHSLNFVSDPEMYYERCGAPTKDDRIMAANGDAKRTLVYSREGVSLYFILRPGQAWQPLPPYATLYPSGDIIRVDAWRQRMHCLFEEYDISSDKE